MFTSIEHFAESWKRESGVTQNCLDALTDESLSQAVADDHRTLDRVAWHIATSIPEVMVQTGMDFGGTDHTDPVPKSAKEIADAYRRFSTKLLEDVTAQWKDETLQTEDEMFGETWKRGFSLHILLVHEIHHRGQLTVLMRQAGIRVPNVYGPAKEGWAEYGVEEPKL